MEIDLLSIENVGNLDVPSRGNDLPAREPKFPEGFSSEKTPLGDSCQGN
ncbi:MAG: hypothetical protein ACYCSP_06690 [Acidobacteriaceae bacterium]